MVYRVKGSLLKSTEGPKFKIGETVILVNKNTFTYNHQGNILEIAGTEGGIIRGVKTNDGRPKYIKLEHLGR